VQTKIMPTKKPIYYSSGKNAPFDKTDLLARGNFKQLKTEGDIFFLPFQIGLLL